jgi:GNAT superfamily N-acetyltransferase
MNFKNWFFEAEEPEKQKTLKLGPATRIVDMEKDNGPVRIKLGSSWASKSEVKSFIDDFNDSIGSEKSDMDPTENFYEDENGTLIKYKLVPGYLAKNSVSLSNFHTIPPKTGAGGKLLKTLIDLADDKNIILELEAVPLKVDNKIPLEKLKNFYRRFGFKDIKNDSTMVRNPRKEER